MAKGSAPFFEKRFEGAKWNQVRVNDPQEIQKNIFSLSTFVTLFPQLVAGPIERATNLLPQILRKRQFEYNSAIDGCRQILWGFFKKLVVADNCAIAVDTIWSNYQNESGFTLLIGGILFAFQIYLFSFY